MLATQHRLTLASCVVLTMNAILSALIVWFALTMKQVPALVMTMLASLFPLILDWIILQVGQDRRRRNSAMAGTALFAALAFCVFAALAAQHLLRPQAWVILILATSALLTSFVILLMPKWSASRCSMCDYPLIGLRGPRCPECGAAVQRELMNPTPREDP